jgi:hypothetical protein
MADAWRTNEIVLNELLQQDLISASEFALILLVFA